MKKSNKDKLKQKRAEEKRRKQEEDRKKKNEIIRTISKEEIKILKKFNMNSFINEATKEEMLECLHSLLNIVAKSSYLDEVTRMARNNISTEWFDREIDNDFIEEILVKELKNAENSSTESVSLKLCYWSNRIAHHIEKEVIGKEKKHKMNGLYLKYFMNSKYKYDPLVARDALEKGDNTKEVELLEQILRKEATFLEDIRTPEELNNLFLGLNLRNEFWTLKHQMLKSIILNTSREENSPVKVTSITERKEVAINGSETLRLVIREINGIAPVVMHCNKEKIDEFLMENKLQPIQEETSKQIIKFAQNGKVGIHFVLDEEDREILEYEASSSVTANRLNNIVYRGETEEDGR